MLNTLKAKLTLVMSHCAGSSAIIVFVGLVAAAIFFFLGIEPAGELLLVGRSDSIAGIWTVMAASFFGGHLSQFFAADRKQWESKTVITPAESAIAGLMWNGVYTAQAHEDGAKPGWIGIGLFVFILLINAGFDFDWDYISRALPAGLIAWGAYALIIQAPWSAYLRSVAEKRSTKRTSYTQYIIEAKRSSTAAWEKLHSSEDLNDCKEVLQKYKAGRVSGEYDEMRVVEEVGMRQVRMTFD